jgi:hypothetical protein
MYAMRYRSWRTTAVADAGSGSPGREPSRKTFAGAPIVSRRVSDTPCAPKSSRKFWALLVEARLDARDGNAMDGGFGGQHLRPSLVASVGIRWQLGRAFGERDAPGDEGLRTVRA